MTLGHEPQSIDISSVGGWIATRATGQLSSFYGGIEDLVAGLEVVLPHDLAIASDRAMFRQVGLGRMAPLRHPVALVATDVDGTPTWVLGAPGERAEEEAVHAVVSGPAEGLALTLWRRLTPAEAGLVVAGDRAVLDAALAQPIVP